VNLDRIAVRGIRAYGKHGALAGERDDVQPFDLAIELEVDLSAARASDRLADTLDYAAVHARVVELVRETSYALLERLGEEILRTILSDERVHVARVTIAKPNVLDGATPSVTLHAARGRSVSVHVSSHASASASARAGTSRP
jgi:dihydroneopterin aldolase